MAVTKIFDSANNFSSRQSQHGDPTIATRHGICAALSALWCLHMQEGKDDLLTKPSFPRAQALQVKYLWDRTSTEQAYFNLLEEVGLTGVIAFRDKALGSALAGIAYAPGTYHLSILGYHSVAACKKGAKYYFYDCDELGAGGLYVCDKGTECTQLAKKYYAHESFLGIRVALA
jgi:hypothetical protein